MILFYMLFFQAPKKHFDILLLKLKRYFSPEGAAGGEIILKMTVIGVTVE